MVLQENASDRQFDDHLCKQRSLVTRGDHLGTQDIVCRVSLLSTRMYHRGPPQSRAFADSLGSRS